MKKQAEIEFSKNDIKRLFDSLALQFGKIKARRMFDAVLVAAEDAERRKLKLPYEKAKQFNWRDFEPAGTTPFTDYVSREKDPPVTIQEWGKQLERDAVIKHLKAPKKYPIKYR